MDANPQPRTDETGVPHCTNQCSCMSVAKDGYSRVCAFEPNRILSLPFGICLPAVRQMAAELRELEEFQRLVKRGSHNPPTPFPRVSGE